MNTLTIQATAEGQEDFIRILQEIIAGLQEPVTMMTSADPNGEHYSMIIRTAEEQAAKDQATNAKMQALKNVVERYQELLGTMPDVSVWGVEYWVYANWAEKKESLERDAKNVMEKVK